MNQTITLPDLNEGEFWAGIYIDPEDKKTHHVILLPNELESANHKTATDWAESIGGALPDRCEQSLLYAFLKKQFKEDWYWSSEQHASLSQYAWCQGFSNGFQLNNFTYDKLRARAVRRVAI